MLIAKTDRKRFIKFALVGLSGTIIDFSIFNLLIYIQLDSIFAGTVSFIVAVFNNFFLNRNWTFPESKISPIASQLIKFSLVSIVGLFIRNILYKIIEQPSIKLAEGLISENKLFSAKVLGQNISLALVIIVVLLWNFLINRFWTYREIS